MSEFQELKKKRFPYRITKTNWIVYAVACFIAVLMSLKEIHRIPEFIGHAIGLCFAFLLFASFFGLLFWFILGRKQNGGSTTFTVLIILTLLGQINNFAKNSNESTIDTSELKIAITKYKEDLKNDSIKGDVAFQNFTDVLEKNVDLFITQSSGDQKELFIGLKEFITEAKAEGNIWTTAQSKIASESFFDFSILHEQGEVESQIQIARDFAEASKRYKLFIQSRLKKLNQIIKNKDIDDEFSKAIIDVIEQKVKKQNPIFVPYIDNNITYGNKMVIVLEMIKKNKWSKTPEGYIEFKDALIDTQFNDIMIELTEIEEKVNDLHGKLIDVI
ncbi:hypothetical protein [Flavobacterium sp.]|uniref:hypothetical protein n=3 Tax=Flavobacterium sp. TaxID=239 RepID=UPI0040488DE8